jgi:hypothetical protein
VAVVELVEVHRGRGLGGRAGVGLGPAGLRAVGCDPAALPVVSAGGRDADLGGRPAVLDPVGGDPGAVPVLGAGRRDPDGGGRAGVRDGAVVGGAPRVLLDPAGRLGPAHPRHALLVDRAGEAGVGRAAGSRAAERRRVPVARLVEHRAAADLRGRPAELRRRRQAGRAGVRVLRVRWRATDRLRAGRERPRRGAGLGSLLGARRGAVALTGGLRRGVAGPATPSLVGPGPVLRRLGAIRLGLGPVLRGPLRLGLGPVLRGLGSPAAGGHPVAAGVDLLADEPVGPVGLAAGRRPPLGGRRAGRPSAVRSAAAGRRAVRPGRRVLLRHRRRRARRVGAGRAGQRRRRLRGGPLGHRGVRLRPVRRRGAVGGDVVVGLPAAPAASGRPRIAAVLGEQLGDGPLARLVGLGTHRVHRAPYVVKRPTPRGAPCAERSVRAPRMATSAPGPVGRAPAAGSTSTAGRTEHRLLRVRDGAVTESATQRSSSSPRATSAASPEQDTGREHPQPGPGPDVCAQRPDAHTVVHKLWTVAPERWRVYATMDA